MNNNKKVFTDIYGLELLVSYRKSAIIFELGNDINKNQQYFKFIFNIEIFKELFDYLMDAAGKAWSEIQLKECNSLGSDYEEYYDKKLDNNGYLHLFKNKLELERVSLYSNKLYQFNKAKIQSFLYDFKKILESCIIRGELNKI